MTLPVKGAHVSPHFQYGEFWCHCNGTLPGCRSVVVSHVLADALETYRAALSPGGVLVVSGYRCHEYNGRIGGAGNSQHLYGNAADVPAHASFTAVKKLGVFSGIGIVRSNGLVSHVDVRHVGPNTTGGTPSHPTIWYY